MSSSQFNQLLNQGIAALQAGRPRDACTYFARAQKLSPQSPEVAFSHGTALIASSEMEAAETQLREAVRLRPGYVEAWERLALLLQKLERHKDALPCLDALVRLKPGLVRAWVSYGSCLFELERFGASLRCHERALKLDSSVADARLGRACALHRLHRYPEAVADYEAYLAKAPHNALAWSQRLMAANHLAGLSREALWKAHREFGSLYSGSKPRRFTPDANPDRRLRVAFLSPDLRIHSVAFFIEPILRCLDRGAFEIYLYHDNKDTDIVSERLKAYASCWRNFQGLANDAVETLILGDAPDILVDLAGHTGRNRLPLFARRLAPLQVSYLGYPNTTGLEAMDYRFVDPVSDPGPEDQSFHSEKLLRFSPCAWCYDPLLSTPEPAMVPRSERGGICFGSFNILGKVTEEVLRVWKTILDRVPDSRLLLKSPDLSTPDVLESALQRFKAAGLDEKRLELHARTATHQEHLSLYNRIDVALDPFPYNGTTTTCEALWMGVPVITLKGDRHAARVGESLLTALGHPEWVAGNIDQYVELAVKEVSGSPRTEARAELRSAMQASPLMDHSGQAARFGAALREAWRCGCPEFKPL